METENGNGNKRKQETEEGGNRSHGYRCIGKSEFIYYYYLFILNKDCVRFGKGKVEVKSWRCMENLDR